MNRYLAELIGTFCLVFAGTAAIINNEQTAGAVTLVGIAITFGAVVMAMIYSIGEVSGAHINPAVTVAFYVAGRFPAKEVAPYVVTQIAGAILASGLIRLLYPESITLGATLPAGTILQSFVFELVLTFILMFVILNVTVGGKEKGISAGIIIGSTVMFEVFVGGPVSGASMNPARSIGPAIVSGQWQHLWMYVVATTLGAILAVPVCSFLQTESSEAGDLQQLEEE